VSQRLGALRFFYTQVLKQTWSTAETPYPKKVLHLPQVLSREEKEARLNRARLRWRQIELSRTKAAQSLNKPA
jgi:hypothetical protein